MKTYIIIEEKQIDLESHLSRTRTIVTLGRQSDEIYNVLALDDDAVDFFQCQFTRIVDGHWKVQNGQWRTECPKGIRSRLQHACHLCMGRCVNAKAAHPTYSWRHPLSPTLLNGKELPSEGKELKDGDMIHVGERILRVNII
jgi:hypothetical protein